MGRLARVATYEVMMLFPGVSYDENRRFLASVAAAGSSPLHGFRQAGEGVALTFIVVTGAGIDFALRDATQRAAGPWPNQRPVATTVRVTS